MKKLKSSNDYKSYVSTLMVFVSRFIGLAPNFSAVGSLGFFGSSPVLFFAVIILFDFIKGGLYPGFIFTYFGFAAYYILGRLAKNNKQRFLLLPMASFLFFLVSNFGVWLFWYNHTMSDLLRCYLVAIPFYKNTLLGDVFFGYGYMAMNYLRKWYSKRINQRMVCQTN